MTRTFAVIATMGALAIGAEALAVNSASPSTLARRQLADCVTRQMSASKTISYNEATKACKDQLKSRKDSVAANNATKPIAAR
jgi:hypothetical protein